MIKFEPFRNEVPKRMCVVIIEIHKTHTNMGCVNTSKVTTAPFHISEADRQLGVSPEHIRTLEREERIPPARRDFNGRIYSDFNIALLKSLGVGSRLRKLKRMEEVFGG